MGIPSKTNGLNMPTQKQRCIPEKPRLIVPVPGAVSFTEGHRLGNQSNPSPAATQNHPTNMQGYTK
jgi:hypothetical protein